LHSSFIEHLLCAAILVALRCNAACGACAVFSPFVFPELLFLPKENSGMFAEGSV
jgi:hypothetical protein